MNTHTDKKPRFWDICASVHRAKAAYNGRKCIYCMLGCVRYELCHTGILCISHTEQGRISDSGVFVLLRIHQIIEFCCFDLNVEECKTVFFQIERHDQTERSREEGGGGGGEEVRRRITQ